MQRDALAAIRKAGGSVQYDWQYKDGGRIADGKPRGPKWLADRLGPDYFDTITTVSSGPAIPTPNWPTSDSSPSLNN